MATCDANERISPFASLGSELLHASDLIELKVQLMDAVKAISAVEKQVEKNTAAYAEKLVPQLEEAIEDLKGSYGRR